MNRFLAASVIGLLLLAMFATGVYFYQRYSIILLDPIRAVPADAAMILEIKNPGESLRDFFSGPFRKSVGTDEWIAGAEKNFTLFDSLLRDNSDIAEIWKDQSMVVSTHLVKAGTFDYLYLTNLPRGWTEQKLKRFIEDGWKMPDQIKKREYENVNIYESKLNDSTTFTFASSKSVAIFSVSPLLVEQAIRQLKDGNSVSQSKAFLKVVPPASKSGSIHLYFNNQSLKDLATSISPDYDNSFFKMASSFARWNGFTIESEEGFLSMKGNSVTFDTSSILAYYRNQQQQTLNTASIAPARTALLFEFGLSNFSEYYNHLKSNAGLALDAADRQKVLSDLQSKYSVSFEPAFTSWIGSEMALIITEPAGITFENNIYACIKARNSADALNQLNTISNAVAKQAGVLPTEEKYMDHIINNINVKGIIPLFYGKMFSGLNGCSYTMLNDYIVFSNQNASLKSLIDENEESKVLQKDDLFRSATNHLDIKGNVRLYVNPQRSSNLYHPSTLQSFLSTVYSSAGIHAQWDYSGTVLNTQMHFDFHKKTMKEPVLFWSTQLDTILASVPVTAKESDGKSYVYVQDEKNSLYKLDESGSPVWKKNLEEKIHGVIIPVDIYHDGRQQLLFNTSSKLYLLDNNGENTGHYPIRLPSPATNGCTAVTTPYSFNVYVACSNHYIYAYEAGGKPVVDWNYLHTVHTVSKPIQAFQTRQNTYLVVNEDSGKVMITDRKGNQKTSFEDKFIQSMNGKCFLFESDSSGNPEWMTTDTAGRIILFTPGGTVRKTATGDFSPAHTFYLSHTTGNSAVGVVYEDNGTLYLVNEDGETILTKPVNGFTSLQSAIRLPDGSSGMLLSSPTNDMFTILNSKGTAEKGFPLKGSINPVMSELHRSVIICGSKDGMLYCYKTE
ncbi:MAG: DUF3352 domain-containing protein [Bacteroidota bacterium]